MVSDTDDEVVDENLFTRRFMSTQKHFGALKARPSLASMYLHNYLFVLAVCFKQLEGC